MNCKLKGRRSLHINHIISLYDKYNFFVTNVPTYFATMREIDPYDLACNDLRHIEANFNVNISLTILRYIGNWPPQGRYRPLYILYATFSFMFIPASLVIIQTGYMIHVWGDIEKMIAASSLLMTNAGHCYKMLSILLRQKRIQALLDVMESEIFSRDKVKYERIFTWYAWNGIFHHLAYQTLGATTVFCWGYSPIANILAGRVRSFPIESWYPYDTDKSPHFEITCAHQIIAVIMLSPHHVAMDTLATNLISVACCQLEILKRNMETIDSEDDYEKTSPRVDEPSNKLNYCIKHNEVIVQFIDEIQDLFGAAFIYHCFVNCAIVCLATFHITQMTDVVLAEIVGMTMYVAAIIYQIFIFCWHGNELALQSGSISLAGYNGNWWKFSERYKSSLRIVMIRSSRLLIIKAGGILTISIDTFMSIIRMSYSLFTVLQSSTGH